MEDRFVIEKYADFMGSCTTYEEAQAVLVGVPMDFTVSFRPGSRFGPQGIRQVSYGLEEYSPPLDRELGDVKFYDWGDLALPFGNIKACLDQTYAAIQHILQADKIPFVLGGEHLISLPVIQAVHEKWPDVAIIHFDAHADLREEYMGERLSHATVMKRVSEIVSPANIYQFGIRSGTKEEFAFAKNHTHLFSERFLEGLQDAILQLNDRPVYITLDIDVVDPAFVPGTGTPEPGGCLAGDIFKAIHLLKEMKVIGMDLVEVAPLLDPSQRTSLMGAKIVREALLSFIR